MSAVECKTRSFGARLTPSAAIRANNGLVKVKKPFPKSHATAGARPRAVSCRADVNWDAYRQPYQAPSSTFASAAAGNSVQQFDFLVVGSGIAGLSYALKVAQYGRVAIITKDHANEGCTQYAQGGVCAVLDVSDSVQSHVEDTMIAGAFLNDRKAVDVVCREGPARVLDLVRLGADFTRNYDGSLHLTREGGHSNRRIVHAADLTGKEIERALLHTARSHANITFYEHHLVTELVVDEVSGTPHCFGVDVLDTATHTMTRFLGLATMLASGGAGQVYPNTTNPHVSTGDGVAMAYRAGAAISNMEFVQFHPTALYSPPAAGAPPAGRTFLITEAVRGEGGMLFNLKGERFMSNYDKRLELAPRDVVARAIQDQMLSHGTNHVWLDISHKPAAEVASHFPNIAKRCAEDGIDITKDPIPVLPAQHYMCGGVSTGLLGDTSIQGLYACGEVACSGLHGANRLASNSLLEGLVFADRAVGSSVAHAEYALKNCGRQLQYAGASTDFRGSRAARPLGAVTAAWVTEKKEGLRALMWRAAGITRRTQELEVALQEIAGLYMEVSALYKSYGVAAELVEVMNLVTVAELIVSCALQRRESRGLHYSADYPRTVPSEARASLIASSFRSRYDLDSLVVSSAGGGVSTVKVMSGAAVAGGGKRVSAAAGASPAPSAGGVSAGVGSRDLSVRSLPAEE